MEFCLTKYEFAQFLSLIEVSFSKINAFTVAVHATAGDAFYIWNGVRFCVNSGILS